MQGVGVRMRAAVVVAVVVAVGAVGLLGVPSAGAGSSVRGFDGTTITLAGLGIKSTYPAAEVGAEARVKRFNDTNEIKGITLKFAELADDKQDPATALSEARRLVTQVGAFAIVPDISTTNPVDYFEQQKVPYIGPGFDATYCANKPTTALWGYSVIGCAVPQDPSFVMTKPVTYKYVSKESGKKHPTVAILGLDSATGVNAARIHALQLQASGLDVVSLKTNAPATGTISDYSPYVQQLLTAADGSPPDLVHCSMALQCLGLYEPLRQSGFDGLYMSPLFSDILVKPMDGSGVAANIVNPSEDTPGYRQLKADFEAVKAGSSAKLDFGGIFSYGAMDAFIQALKKVARDGKANITPENVRKVASTMKWGIDGVIGPVEYPKSTVMPYPQCQNVVVSDGTTWNTAEPYSCSKKNVSPKIKLG
jgi:ABC-type branched-subunit amino acid transport system substrate-binding protein